MITRQIRYDECPMSDGELAELIQRYLQRAGHSQAADILRGLRGISPDPVDVGRIVKVLYMRTDLFCRLSSSTNASSWKLVASGMEPPNGRPPVGVPREQVAKAPAPPPLPPPAAPTVPVPPTVPGLYNWQREALEAWRSNGRTGIVEAVTGAGKTRVAVQAIAESLVDTSACALILVPTTALATQWKQRLDEIDLAALGVPPAPIGILGGGETASFTTHRILISTMQSASTRLLLGRAGPSLLIGDEVHRLGAPTWSRALDPAFRRRLGLTATLEREDEGVAESIEPYFGKTVFTLGLKRALQDQVVAPFHVTFVGVELTIAERKRYKEASETISKSMSAFANCGHVPMQPFGEMMRAVHALATRNGDALTGTARAYLKAFSERKAVLAEAQGKFRRVSDLAPTIARSGRALLFAETVTAVDRALKRLTDAKLPVAAIDGETDADERVAIMEEFRNGRLKALAAPRVLDEGIDVPEADIGIIVAGTSSRRQLIQRLGRVIRRKADGRAARIFVLFVEGTPEDPESSQRQQVVAELMEHAASANIIRASDSIA